MPRTVLAALVRHSLRHQRNLIIPQTPIYRHTRRSFSMSNSTQYSSSSSSSKDGSTPTAAAAAVDETAASSSAPRQGLPAPGEEGSPITLDVSGGGSTVKLSDLGPLVVNVDGTVARISNWPEMTEVERETAMRMVGGRNKKRLDALKKLKDEQEGTSQ